MIIIIIFLSTIIINITNITTIATITSSIDIAQMLLALVKKMNCLTTVLLHKVYQFKFL